MLTRFVRIQLLIFTIIGIIGLTAMVFFYIQAPMLLGIGRITVSVELPGTGGLYRFSNVTYRGVQVGKVTAVSLTAHGAKATLSLGTSPKIPANLQADVLSVSAVGEQYVDLRPRTDSGPYLHDGSVIAMHDTTIPQAVGPMLDQVNALVKSLPKNKIGQLLDESFQAFNGAGYDLGSLSDSASRISADSNNIVERTRALTEDSQPLLNAQAQTTDSIRTWARSLAGISDVLANDDSQVRTVLENGPGALDEASRLFEQIKPTLPLLLANLTTIGQIGVTYHPSIEQVLVLMPAAVAYEQTAGRARTGPTVRPGVTSRSRLTIRRFARLASCHKTNGDPRLTRARSTLPMGCTANFRRTRRFRFVALATIHAWGIPESARPPSKSATAISRSCRWRCASMCSARPPLDPNLLAQGIPPDDRVTADKRIFGPVEGTPLPLGAIPRGAPAGPRGATPPPGTLGAATPPVPSSANMSTQSCEFPSIAPLDVPAPPPAMHRPPAPPRPPAVIDGGRPQAAPSSFGGKTTKPVPSVAVASYDPRTGRYLTPDGKYYQQSDLATSTAPRKWQDLFPT